MDFVQIVSNLLDFYKNCRPKLQNFLKHKKHLKKKKILNKSRNSFLGFDGTNGICKIVKWNFFDFEQSQLLRFKYSSCSKLLVLFKLFFLFVS